MRIALVTPNLPEARSGNFITAARFRRLLQSLGHRVTLATSYDGEPCEAMIALHARRSAPSIARFAEQRPGQPLTVVLTGTDLYRDIRDDAAAQRSLELASRLVVLQPMGLHELPERHRPKTRVIYQSVIGCQPRGKPPSRVFRVAVVGHLRPEKDSLRTALAARLLPRSSRIQVLHAGAALSDELGAEAERESRTNPRYRWLGGLPHWRT